MARKLTIKLTPVEGTIERFYAFVAGHKRLAHDGDSERSWSGSVDDHDVPIKLRVFGMDRAKYRVVIDLPGTMDDQTLELSLDQGYGELELRV